MISDCVLPCEYVAICYVLLLVHIFDSLFAKLMKQTNAPVQSHSQIKKTISTKPWAHSCLKLGYSKKNWGNLHIASRKVLSTHMWHLELSSDHTVSFERVSNELMYSFSYFHAMLKSVDWTLTVYYFHTSSAKVAADEMKTFTILLCNMDFEYWTL